MSFENEYSTGMKLYFLCCLIFMPFIVGAIWNFVGAWAGIPALLVIGIFWLSSVIALLKGFKK